MIHAVQNLPLAAIDPSLITLLVIGLLSAISSWLQRKRQGGMEDWESPSDPDSSQGGPAKEGRPSSKPKMDWEREIRKMLGEPVSETSPPVLESPTKQAQEARTQRGDARAETEESEPAQGTMPEGPSWDGIVSQEEEARERVARLKKELEAKRRLTARRQAKLKRRQEGASAPASALLKNRASLKQAFQVSLILAPPIALRSHDADHIQ